METRNLFCDAGRMMSVATIALLSAPSVRSVSISGFTGPARESAGVRRQRQS
jgi:hypothetical protein